MKRIIFILFNVFLGVLLLHQFRAVFSQNMPRYTASDDFIQAVSIIDLGTLGGETSQAADLNNLGEVIGYSELSPGEAEYAFRWLAKTMTPLLAIEGETTNAFAINESGFVVGETNSGGSEAVRMPALWDEDSYSPLPIDQNTQGTARAVNDTGMIAGHTLEETNNNILIWENDVLMETIPVVDGEAQVNDLNNQQQIVGVIHDGSANEAFLWQDGTFEGLGTLGGQHSIAYGINDERVVVGSASTIGDLATHAFLWQEGAMTDLGTLGDDTQTTSQAFGINSAGIIVGEAQVGDEMHAVMWAKGTIIDLNTLLHEESPWEVLSTAVSVNEKGWIAGTGLIEGKEHAFLLIPLLDNFSYLPVIIYDKPTPIPTATPSATPMPTSTPKPSPTPSTAGYDLAKYLTGDGRLYEVHFKAGDFETQARHQTQFSGGHFYHTKGNEIKAEWEELWNDSYYIYRGTDTSPGNDLYYTLYGSLEDYLAGEPGSQWSERYMKVGEMYFRKPYVVFFNKSDCSVASGGYLDPSWLKFQAFHTTYTFDTGLTLNNVVELAWMQGNEAGPTQPVDERYFYAEGYGLVGWKKPSLGWGSAINEEHLPGARPDNVREEIGCLNSTRFTPQSWSPKLHNGPLPEPYAGMVKP